jgi:O-antigen/teichoic acid export membrane protein
VRLTPWRNRKGTFVYNVALLLTGNFIAQAITFGFMPLITRLFSPSALGLLGVFLSACAMTIPLATLGYPIAIVLPEKDIDAFGLALLSFFITIFMSLLVFGVLLLHGDYIVHLFNIEEIGPYIYIVPAVMLFSAFSLILSHWTTRKRLFKEKAVVSSLHSFFVNGLKLVFGLVNPAAVGLIIATLLGFLFQVVALQNFVFRRAPFPPMGTVSLGTLRFLARKYRAFPLFRLPEQILNALSVSMPLFVLTSAFGPQEAGYFALALSALKAPAFLVGKSVSEVFYSSLSIASKKGELLTPKIVKVTVFLLVFSSPICAAFMAFGQEIFGFVFGPNWSPAGEQSRWIAPWVVAALANKPTVAAIPILAAQKALLAHTIFSICFRAAAILWSTQACDSVSSVIAVYCTASIAMNALVVIIGLAISRKQDSKQTQEARA